MTIHRICFFVFLLTTLQGMSQVSNVALNKPVRASSSAPGFPAEKMVDGVVSRNSKWQAGSGQAPHIIEIELQRYYTIQEMRVHSGILDSEKRPDEMNQAAGFWSVKNFRLQYWDDANWSDFPKSEVHENRLASVVFTYATPVTTFRIRLVCDDGEPINIMEIEAMGMLTPNMPAPPTVNAKDITQQPTTSAQTADVKITKKVVGKSMQYVGYNQGYYMLQSNTSAWIEYSGVNSVRLWATLNAFAPATSFQLDNSLTTLTEFEKRKNELRQSPEKNKYIRWETLLPLYNRADSSSTNSMVLNFALHELKRMNIDVVLQTGNTDFDSTWSNKWKQWQRHYALAYHAAKEGNVFMFAIQNEPNHRNSGPMKLDQWIMAMQLVSDAIHCAVADVNKKYGKKLVAKMVGPVTAGNNAEWWSAVAKNIRTDYKGKTVDKDLLEIFSTHSYNSPAAGYESRINSIRKIIMDNHPAGKPLPIVYTEIGRWMNAYLIDKEETMDSPSLFTEWAGIYTNNTKNGGYGMWAFKFANTTSGPYPNGIKSGHHFTWQGKRIVEDAYVNIALGATVTASVATANARYAVDGIKDESGAWIADSSAMDKWIEIDLGSTMKIGSAVVYTGSAGGVYTGPDRVKNFVLQYADGTGWKDIEGTARKDNKYAQLFVVFSKTVTTRKVRFVSSDKTMVKVREIKLFADGDGPASTPNYNVSGIQRTGQVVRLFAKGFKNERPLLESEISTADPNLDILTSYDSVSGNYYVWLVQRGLYTTTLHLDLSSLGIAKGTVVSAESVGPAEYGEVVHLLSANDAGKITVPVTPQSVMLLTFPENKMNLTEMKAVADASVKGGRQSLVNFGTSNELTIALDAANETNNEVSYIRFDITGKNIAQAQRVLLKVHGHNATDSSLFRFHVYGMSTAAWKENKLTWKTASHLVSKEALIHRVGQEVWVAGELVMDNTKEFHYLDVTDLVKKHATSSFTFVLVRETRQLGDDSDKGKRIVISSKEGIHPPALLIYSTKK